MLGPLLALALCAAPSPEDRAECRMRREALGRALGEDAVAVVLGASAEDEFRQKPAFFYLTGLEEPDAVLLLEPGNRERPEVLYLKPRDRAQERWSGPTLGPGDVDEATGEPDAERRSALEASGVGAVRPLAALDGDLQRALGRGRRLRIDAPSAAPGRPASAELELVRSIRERRASLEVAELAPQLRELRMIKSEAELERIRKACDITMEAQREAARAIVPGAREYEVKARIEYVFRSRGSVRPAFPSIVGSGPNSTILHFRGDRRQMQTGDLVVVDIGAEWEGYAADVTRTWPVGGRFGPEQRKVYDTVLAAQEAALARVKAGAKLRSDVHAAAVKVIEAAGYQGRFPHSTSHHLGLEVHDPGERDGVLRAGMVITLEPGIYLAESAIGVRIEDVVRVTKDGYEHLTRALPRRAEDIEALMALAGASNAPAAPSSQSQGGHR